MKRLMFTRTDALFFELLESLEEFIIFGSVQFGIRHCKKNIVLFFDMLCQQRYIFINDYRKIH